MILSTGGGGEGASSRRRCLVPREVGLLRGECLVTGGGAWWRPPGTATAAGGAHPTGMHYCGY